MNDLDHYMLRYAAGVYWLIKVDQQDACYTAPIMINDVGAVILKGMKEGAKLWKIAKMLEGQYDIDPKQALEDVDFFYDQLKKCITGGISE